MKSRGKPHIFIWRARALDVGCSLESCGTFGAGLIILGGRGRGRESFFGADFRDFMYKKSLDGDYVQPENNDVKYLGVIFDRHLKFEKQIHASSIYRRTSQHFFGTRCEIARKTPYFHLARARAGCGL